MPPRPSPQAGADGAPADRPAEMTDDDELAGGTAAGSDDESSGSTGSTPPPLEPANTELAAFWVSQAAVLLNGSADAIVTIVNHRTHRNNRKPSYSS